jgi:deoxyribose-phosphate aldolase
MKIDAKGIARLFDASALKMDATYTDFIQLVQACKKYNFGCAFTWNYYSKELGEALKGTTTEFGTSLSFPIGQDTTAMKVEQARYFVSLGADQIDMVMNVGLLKSGLYDRVYDDLASVRQATRGTSLKVIIEAMLLSDEQIIKASEIVMASGCNFVKSGSGFSADPTTLHHIALMKKTVGSACKIKAAGGIRELDMLLKMHAIGANLFGIGYANAIRLVEEVMKYPDGIDIPDVRLEDYL